jgi:hypothetical protein
MLATALLTLLLLAAAVEEAVCACNEEKGEACTGRPVEWTQPRNAVSSTAGRIEKNAGGNERNAGAVSASSVSRYGSDPTVANGVEFTIDSAGRRFRAGLSRAAKPVTYDGDIDFAIGMGGQSMPGLLTLGGQGGRPAPFASWRFRRIFSAHFPLF